MDSLAITSSINGRPPTVDRRADVLELREIPTPEPGDDEVLVRVRAAALNPADWHFTRGKPYVFRLFIGIRKPKKTYILGMDMSGVIEAVGANVKRFKAGDEVFAEVRTGCCAEYVVAKADEIELKPARRSGPSTACSLTRTGETWRAPTIAAKTW